MLILLRKEIGSFFSSLTGYIVIIVFLLINSAFIWLIPGDSNILDSGYATLETFFTLAPWVFLILVPAITMRLFAEEKKSGTLEFLQTKPISDTQLVMAKYLSSISLVLLSLIPCLVFFYSVWNLGNPPGNIDSGAIWGAFTGLFFLAAIYSAIGLFISSVTDNQIVAFIVALLLSLFFFQGFDLMSTFPGFQKADTFLVNLGINEHYKSISRGVIDSRDIAYYLIIISIFILLTKTKLQSRNW
jgi:ABC-2 type transport system permease protein